MSLDVNAGGVAYRVPGKDKELKKRLNAETYQIELYARDTLFRREIFRFMMTLAVLPAFGCRLLMRFRWSTPVILYLLQNLQ